MSEIIQVILTDTPNTVNKKLLMFFDKNLSTLLNAGLQFDWVVAYKEELQEYSEQGINRFPVLIPPGAILPQHYYSGTSAIIDFLTQEVNRYERTSAPKKKSDGDVMDYLMVEATGSEEADEDMDEDEIFRNTLTTRVNEMNEARKQAGLHSKTTGNPEIHEKMANSKTPARHPKPVRNDNLHTTWSSENKALADKAGSGGGSKVQPNILNAVKKSAKKQDGDDQLMEKFWQNQALSM